MGHKVRYKGGPSNFEKQWNNEIPECFYLVSPEPQNPPPTENLSKFCLGELDNFFLFFFLVLWSSASITLAKGNRNHVLENNFVMTPFIKNETIIWQLKSCGDNYNYSSLYVNIARTCVLKVSNVKLRQSFAERFYDVVLLT